MNKYLGKFAAVRRFFKAEEGLVAVEWVALTSGLVIAAIIIGVLVMDQTALEADGMVAGIQADADAVLLNADNLTDYAP